MFRKFGKSGKFFKNSGNWFRKIEKLVIFWKIQKF